jgi:deazaflavin-dependent oxidoreductase (nitroreductase family)
METTNPAVHKVPFFVPLLNPVMAKLVRLGVPMERQMRLLTVRGRRSGRDRTTPVSVFEHDGEQYLFGTFGDTHWVRNLRVAGEAVLVTGHHHSTVAATELTAEEAGPVLQGALAHYLATPMKLFLQRYYAVSADGTPADFIELAHQHPVFRLREIATA